MSEGPMTPLVGQTTLGSDRPVWGGLGRSFQIRRHIQCLLCREAQEIEREMEKSEWL